MRLLNQVCGGKVDQNEIRTFFYIKMVKIASRTTLNDRGSKLR